jgi:hypothetical protein
MGYQPTPQTFTQQGKPAWMQGHFAMDNWGMRADDPTQRVTPDMLDPRTAMFAQRDAYNNIESDRAAMAQQQALAQQMMAQNPYGIQGDLNGQWTPNAIQGGMPPQMPQQAYPAAPQQPGAGSVDAALAKYAGQSSALPAASGAAGAGYPGGFPALPAGGGKGMGIARGLSTGMQSTLGRGGGGYAPIQTSSTMQYGTSPLAGYDVGGA